LSREDGETMAGRLRTAIISFALIAAVVIAFLVIIAVATPGDSPAIPLVEPTGGTQTRNETIPASMLATVAVRAVDVMAEPEAPANATTEPEANETTEPDEPEEESDPYDIFDVSPEAITAAIVQFMREVFSFAGGDSAAPLGFLFEIFSAFLDPDGGWHG